MADGTPSMHEARRLCVSASEDPDRFHASELNTLDFQGAPSFVRRGGQRMRGVDIAVRLKSQQEKSSTGTVPKICTLDQSNLAFHRATVTRV